MIFHVTVRKWNDVGMDTGQTENTLDCYSRSRHISTLVRIERQGLPSSSQIHIACCGCNYTNLRGVFLETDEIQ